MIRTRPRWWTAVGGFLILQACLAGGASAQTSPSDVPPLDAFVWRSIGPVNMAGRITDIEAVEQKPGIVYVGTAGGGVWKTTNNGTTWAPIFDDQPNLSIGDIAIAPSAPDIVWVGTGEANSRQSSSYGAGVYRSTDAGVTWTLMGLEASGSIGRIVIDPDDPNVVYVAAAGDLFKAHSERGLFKTTDGGQTWIRSHVIDDDTGFIDVLMDPTDPQVLFAASYQRRRAPFGFNGGGPGSGLWRTADAGRTWQPVTGGLPPTGQWGRTGLTIHRADPRIMYALIEPGPSTRQPIDPAAPPDPSRPGLWRSDDAGATWRIVSAENGRPMYFSQVRVDPLDPDVVYVLARAAMKSIDGGRTFETLGDAPLFGRDYAPDAAGRRGPAHVDHHALWIDPADTDHLMLGHDGGVDFSYDGGRSWEFQDKMAIGTFYEVAVDMRQPYFVYGGLQDRGMWGGPSRVSNIGGITKAHWFELYDGDGWHVQVDPDDPDIVYGRVSPGGGGTIWRFDLATGEQRFIRPTPTPIEAGAPNGPLNVRPATPAGEAYRFNWNPPLVLSPHNGRIVYFGAHRLFISRDRGDTWTPTADLTGAPDRSAMTIMGVPNADPMTARNDGVGQYGTIVSIAESPVVPGVLWVGTDDGHLQVSRNGGATWREVAGQVPNVPSLAYVESIDPSHIEPGRAYVAFDGHRSGDFRPHLFRTDDYGDTWTSLGANLPPMGPVNVVREDPRNPRLLYVGTENGFYVSLDAGARWTRFMSGLPAVASDDLVIHSREQDLVLGTHGRSIYILDDVTPLQQLTPDVLAAEVHLFDVRPGVLWQRDIRATHGGGTSMFRATNPPDGTYISYLLGAPAPDDGVRSRSSTPRVVSSESCQGLARLGCIESSGTFARPLQRNQRATRRTGAGGWRPGSGLPCRLATTSRAWSSATAR